MPYQPEVLLAKILFIFVITFAWCSTKARSADLNSLHNPGINNYYITPDHCSYFPRSYN